MASFLKVILYSKGTHASASEMEFAGPTNVKLDDDSIGRDTNREIRPGAFTNPRDQYRLWYRHPIKVYRKHFLMPFHFCLEKISYIFI